MTIETDAAKLLTFMDSHDIDASTEVSRGWDHIGAIIVDASLQRRQKYTSTVKPRVEALIAAWPDASTTSGFRSRLDTGEVSDVISWPSPGRLAQIEDITGVFEQQNIDTVEELRLVLNDTTKRPIFREALTVVLHVGPKTLDYMDILSGISTGVAIDVRIRKVVHSAGIEDSSYEHVAAVIRTAAASRNWRAGDLDAALWQFEAQTSVEDSEAK